MTHQERLGTTGTGSGTWLNLHDAGFAQVNNKAYGVMKASTQSLKEGLDVHQSQDIRK